MVKHIPDKKSPRNILDDQSATIGHNSAVQDGGDDGAIQIALSQRVAQLKEKDDLAKKHKVQRNEWKRQGLLLEKIDFNAKILQAAQAIEVTERGLAQDLRYARLAGTVSPQFDLFKQYLPTAKPSELEAAAEKGKRAGLMNDAQKTNPFDASSELGQHWLEWWHTGQDERTRILGMDKKLKAQAAKSDAKKKPVAKKAKKKPAVEPEPEQALQ